MSGQIERSTALPVAAAGNQPLDPDLTAIAALSPSNDDVIQRKAGEWMNRTMAQLNADIPIYGSFVPAFAATSAVFSYGFQGGNYIKIGRLVAVFFQINLNTSGNTLNSNTLSITGLPFTVDPNNKAEFPVRWQNSTTSYISVTGECTLNTATIGLFGLTAAATSNATSVVANGLLHATNGSIVIGSATYVAAT